MSENGQSERAPELQDFRSRAGPACEHCGAVTIFKDQVPHPTIACHELRTYRCPACLREEVLGAPTLRRTV